MFKKIVRVLSIAIFVSRFVASPLSGQVVINEIMFHPPHADDSPEPVTEEFIELFNADPINAVELAGWRFSNGIDFTFESFSIPAGGFVIIAANIPSFEARYPTMVAPVLGPWSGRLSNGGERIRLLNSFGVEMDDVRYSDEGDWAVRREGPRDRGHTGWIWQNDADGAGSSLELINPRVSNEEGQNWSASSGDGGTPGFANSGATTNIAPMIRNVRHTPAVPSPSDQVVVTATLVDELATGSQATLYHRVSTLSAGTFGTVTMVDLGDNVFGGVLPAQSNGSVVEFFIESSDGMHTRRWPAPTDANGRQRANLLYQVDDGTYSGSQGDYRLILSVPEAEEFTSRNFNRGSNAQMNATFISLRGSDADIRYQTGVRRRGAGSRGRRPLTLRLNLPADQPWRGESALNLNSQYPPLQILGQKLYTAAGITAPDARPVQLRINGELQNTRGSANYGTYVHMEPLNGDFVANHIPGDDRGNLYRKRRPDRQLSYENGDVAAYQANGWEKQTNSSDWDWTDLDAMHAVLADSKNPDYLTNLEATINVDQWLRWIAMMTIMANGETNIASGTDDDYAIYRGVADPRFILLPHDLDTILGIGDSSAITNPNRTIYDMLENGPSLPVMEDFIRHPRVLPRYHEQLFELLQTTFEKDRFDLMVDLVTGDLFSLTIRDGIKEFMNRRRAYILSQIQPPLTIDSPLPTANGYAQSTVNYAFLNGVADVRTTSRVQVNGQTADFDSGTGQWSFGTGPLQQITLLPRGSDWAYLDDGSDQNRAWRAPGFDDSAWPSGPAELGYGDNDNEATITGFVDTDPDQGGIQKNATTYFRGSFKVTDVSQITQVIVRLRYDDGGIVYINGSEAVVTSNMRSGALYNEFALDDTNSETNYQAFNVPASLLTEGTNVAAIEIHQGDDSSSDISFDLEIDAIIDTEGGTGVSLDPGINRITVESLDRSDNTIASAFFDAWFDSGIEQTLSGTLAGDTTLTAADGPYRITNDLVVPIDVTLTIQPGTSLFFDAETRLIVNGRLVADGENHRRIRFTRTPGGDNWAGVYFDNSPQDNRISWMDQEFSDSASHSMEVVNSRLTLDHVSWTGTTETIIETSHPQLLIRNCHFPSTSGSEVIHGVDLDGSDYFVVDGNTFQTSSGYNDIIGFTGGRRPGPIIYILNNLFTGATDDCLDLDGVDAHIEGNTFKNVHTDDPSRPSTSTAITTDDNAHITVVRNIFDNVDHAMLLKNDSDAVFENNIVRGATLGAINFDEPLREVDAGSHVVVEGNIFIDNAMTFRHADHLSSNGQPPLITANRNIMPAEDHLFGTGNLDIDPLFAAPDTGDFSLLPGSGAIGSGINGADMGAWIDRGATVSGEPPLNTSLNSATLNIHMPGISGIDSGRFISEYRWRLDGSGPWSPDTFAIIPITLTSLTAGPHFVEVTGKDSAGIWQDETEATRSLTWNVIPGFSTILISEVQTINSTGSATIELHNSGSSPADISGMKISTNPSAPKIDFPVGSIIPAGGYFTISADSTNGLPLSGDGDAVYLFDTTDRIIDSITFGLQIEDLSISRVGRSGEWALSSPTPGNHNVRHPLGDSKQIFINEWLASGDVFHTDDFIELYVASTSPVDISGFHMSDAPDSEPARFQFPPHSYLPGQAFKVMVADNDTALGASHLNFKLDASVEWITLSDPGLSLIDIVTFTNQHPDQTQGRLPDGGARFVPFTLPTAGLSNVQTTPDTVETMAITDWGQSWKYLADGSDQGTAWTARDFDDSDWSSGSGILGDEDDSLPGGFSIETNIPVIDSFITYYFRSSFEYTGIPQEAPIQLESLVDDGAVFYLNGVEIFRQNMPIGDVDFLTGASDSSEASFVGPITVPSDALIGGTNVLAIEVHQINATSSDMVMGAKLSKEVVIPGMINPLYERVLALVNSLRITEIMYHPDIASAQEFIELQNVGNNTIDLTGVRFTDGIDFTFPAMMLAPGETVIIVNELAAFQEKYGNSIAVAGEYIGNLSNGGEALTLKLPAPYDAAILRFEYDDAWYLPTDGAGYSLEIVDSSAPTSAWSRSLNWQPGALQGTPGDIGFDSVSGGSSQNIILPASAMLDGEVVGTWSPDILWEKITGNGSVVISDATAIDTSVAIIEPGTYTFRVTATTPDQTIFDEVTVVVDDVYSQWKIRTGAGDESSDDDGDGLTNLVEYALDTDPHDGEPDYPNSTLSHGIGGTAYEMTYTRFRRKSDITYTAETSDDLRRWTGNLDAVLSSDIDEEVRKVSISTDTAPDQFIRLVITQ